MREVVIVGRGAIGAIYCAACSVCRCVRLRVAADEGRVERYGREPFIFNGEPLALDYFTPKEGDLPVDLIIVATKWEGYRSALELIAPLVGSSTQIMPLLNGLLPYEVAVDRFGEQRVLRAYYIGHTASRTGAEASQDGAYRTVFGERFNVKPYSQRVQQISTLFDACGVHYRVDSDMDSSRWLKFIINLGLNQTSSVDGGVSYGQIRDSARYRALCESLVAEGAAVAAALGVDGAEAMSAKAMELLATLPDGDYSSMAQDVRDGRVAEWPIFAEHLIEMARGVGVDVPAHRSLKMV